MKVQLNTFVLLVIIVANKSVQAGKYLETKPDALNPCHLSEPDFNKCFAKNFQVLFREWKDGIPGYRASGSLDPLHVKRVELNQDPKNPVAFNADLRNVILTGASKTVVKDARFNPKTIVTQLKLFSPKLRFDSDYKLNGRILNLALKGNGKAYFEIENISIFMSFSMKLRDEFGYTFTDIKQLSLDITDVGAFRVHFDNLFNGQKILEESANSVFNENWRDFFEVLRPAVTQAIEVIMKDCLSKASSYVPANYFIEDIPSAAQFNG